MLCILNILPFHHQTLLDWWLESTRDLLLFDLKINKKKRVKTCRVKKDCINKQVKSFCESKPSNHQGLIQSTPLQ